MFKCTYVKCADVDSISPCIDSIVNKVKISKNEERKLLARARNTLLARAPKFRLSPKI